ncbi:hypothetical protein [Devosia sp. CN2-171]|uniref:hypothetical protein n=1 Tax=Devosia sp. CN2-171 TaxID=3400909 RepID=UPI003BF798D3
MDYRHYNLSMQQSIGQLLKGMETGERLYLRLVTGAEVEAHAPFAIMPDHIEYRVGATAEHKVALTPYAAIVQLL